MLTNPAKARLVVSTNFLENKMLEVPRIQHAFTVDVEDWYHGIPVNGETKASAEHRLQNGLSTLLELLAECGVRGTFFWLGPVAIENPHLVQQIAEAGHEIGCHGWSHDLIYTMSPQRFREETQSASNALADITGKPVTAYRAAYFSITRESFWALGILANLGFRYDSSIFPVQNWRYGIADFNPQPQLVNTPAGTIYELPISVRRILGRNIPVSGGAYFRLYPYAITRSNFCAAEREESPVVFYLHPWELDPDHPRLRFHWKPSFTHYVNLRSTKPKLRRLLREFSFAPLSEVLEKNLVVSCR